MVSQCLKGLEFELGKMKEFWRQMVVHSDITERTVKNGQDGKFYRYIKCIYV